MMVQMVLYDIEKNKPRTKLSDYLEHHGLLRIQYSIFAGPVETRRLVRLKQYLVEFKKLHCKETDKIYILGIEDNSFEKMLCLGPELNLDYLLNREHTYYL
jgi:CRISPR-associated protein Cas2